MLLFLSFFGCSNPFGGDDDSNTSSAATWQIQNGFINTSTWEFSETQAPGFSAGSKITLANPNFATIIHSTLYAKQNGSWEETENNEADVTIGATAEDWGTDMGVQIVNNTFILTSTYYLSLTVTSSSIIKFIILLTIIQI